MNTFNFCQAEVVEMNSEDLQIVEGGIFGWDDVAIAVVAYVACEVIDGIARYANGERSR